MNRTFAAALAFAIIVTAAQRAAAQDTTVTIVGVVYDSLSGEPVAQVEVYTPDASTTWTNRNGQFTLSGVSRHEPLLFIRRIGFRKRALELKLADAPPRVALGKVWISPAYFALDTVRVEADLVRTNPKLSEFFRRRRSGMGQYMTATEIFKRNPLVTTDLLRAIAGIGVRCPSGACIPVTFRSGANRPCPMRIILDGMPIRDLELDLIPPSWIAGLEVYRSSNWTPLELGRSGCGTVVIWTGGER